MPTNEEDAVPFRIVVAMDFSDLADLALGEAVAQARWRAPSELHLVTVVDHHGRVENPKERPHSVEEYVSLLNAAAVKALNGGEEGPTLFVHVRVGSPAVELTAHAAEIGADLLVLGTHGRRGLQRLWLGSIAERVVRMAGCPVLMVRPKTAAPAAVDVPQAEPPCQACVAVRFETRGITWWCKEHENPTDRPHAYAYSSVFQHKTDPYNKIW